MSRDKEELREKLEREIRNLKDSSSQAETRLKEEHSWQMEKMEKAHREESETQRRQSQQLMDELRQVFL